MPEHAGRRRVRRWASSIGLVLAYRGAAGAPGFAAEPSAPVAPPVAAPVAAAIERVTFAEALARARARNPNALTAAQQVRRAEALLIETRAASLPSVVPQATYTRIDGNRVFMGQTLTSVDQITAAGGIAVPLLVPQRWAAWAHAADDRRVAELSVAEVQRQVAIAVGHTYLDVIAQHQAVAALTNARDAARAHADYAAQQDAAGAVSHLDAVRAAQAWHTAVAQLDYGVITLQASQEALGVLVAGDRPLDTADTPALPVPAVSDAPADSLQALRADIIAQTMRQTAAQHQVRDSWTDYMPYLLGRFDPLYNNPPTIFQPRFAWQAQLQLVLPLFEGGLRAGQLRERRALLDEASIALDAQLRQARADVRFGFEAVERAEQRLREATLAAKLAHDALTMSSLRYREGASTNLDVIDAQRQARDSDLTAAIADNNARQLRLDLLAAAGRFP
jgi:outer membrane protein TolC